MTEKKLDMFKLVEEVEKRKSADIDEIFNDLDSIKKEDVKPDYVNTASHVSSSVTLVKKPTLPSDDEIGPYVTRFEAFRGYIEHVAYAANTNNEYNVGHSEAVKKYYEDAFQNRADLYMTESRVATELNRFPSKQRLFEKGYYDGLSYIADALKRSQKLLMRVLNELIRKNL